MRPLENRGLCAWEWMGEHVKLLIGSGVPSPVPHIWVLSLSGHVLARKIFPEWSKERDWRGHLGKGDSCHMLRAS